MTKRELAKLNKEIARSLKNPVRPLQPSPYGEIIARTTDSSARPDIRVATSEG